MKIYSKVYAMASNLSTNPSLLCSACNHLLEEPRVSQCGHLFCTKCLKEILNKLENKKLENQNVDGKENKNLIFRCPDSECGNEYSIPDTNIKAFPVVKRILPLLESERINQGRSICSKHRNRCNFFCKKCRRELCENCLSDHAQHEWTHSDDANKEFIGKCQKAEEENLTKFHMNEEKIKNSEQESSSNEKVLEENVEKSMKIYSTTKVLIEEEEINSLTRILQEYERKNCFHEKAQHEKIKWPFQQVNQILRPILKAPSGKVMEPVLILELAEFYLQQSDKNLESKFPKMEGKLSDESQIAKCYYREVCSKLGERFSPNQIDKSAGPGISLFAFSIKICLLCRY